MEPVRADTAHAASEALAAVDLLVTAHGAGTFAITNLLQRIWRAINVAARHAIFQPEVAKELYGKSLLGVEDQITPMI